MKGVPLRRIACMGAMLGLSVASSPRLQAASAAPAAVASVNSSHAPSPAAAPEVRSLIETGKGWGSMISCAACAVAAGITIAGGPATILVAVNAPGSAIALLACVAACYEAFQ